MFLCLFAGRGQSDDYRDPSCVSVQHQVTSVAVPGSVGCTMRECDGCRDPPVSLFSSVTSVAVPGSVGCTRIVWCLS